MILSQHVAVRSALFLDAGPGRVRGHDYRCNVRHSHGTAAQSSDPASCRRVSCLGCRDEVSRCRPVRHRDTRPTTRSSKGRFCPQRGAMLKTADCDGAYFAVPLNLNRKLMPPAAPLGFDTQ